MGTETKIWLIIAAIIVGAIVLIVLPIIFFSLKSADKRFAQLWPALAPAVGGTSGTNFKSNTMTGAYEGRSVVARTVNERALAKARDARTAAVLRSEGVDVYAQGGLNYFFELAMTVGSQGKDWSLQYGGEGFFGGGEQAWHIQSKDEILKQSFTEQGAASMMQSWKVGDTVKYKAGPGVLTYRTAIANQYALPTPEEFKVQLALLSHLAGLNKQLNVNH
jgi:hypothetical protein